MAASSVNPKKKAAAGTRHWWAQRASALALVPLTVWFTVSMAAMTAADYGAFVAWVSNPVVTVLLVLFIALVFYHLRLGVQVVIDDYVHGKGLRAACWLVNDAYTLVLGLVTVVSVLRAAFGM